MVLSKTGVFAVDEQWLTNLSSDSIVSSVEELTEDDKFILMSQSQIDFFNQIDPDEFYTPEQIFYMINISKEELLQNKINRIREIRRNLYAKYSDPLYIEYQKELAIGNIEKAETIKQEWLLKAKEIEENNPYPTE